MLPRPPQTESTHALALRAIAAGDTREGVRRIRQLVDDAAEGRELFPLFIDRARRFLLDRRVAPATVAGEEQRILSLLGATADDALDMPRQWAGVQELATRAELACLAGNRQAASELFERFRSARRAGGRGAVVVPGGGGRVGLPVRPVRIRRPHAERRRKRRRRRPSRPAVRLPGHHAGARLGLADQGSLPLLRPLLPASGAGFHYPAGLSCQGCGAPGLGHGRATRVLHVERLQGSPACPGRGVPAGGRDEARGGRWLTSRRSTWSRPIRS